jgi:REP element-mobilizing transposase RayT
MEREWHSRGYLPHWEAGETPQSITFRLADSLPRDLLDRWRDELAVLPPDKADLRRRARMQAALDRGHGDPRLSNPDVAQVVEATFIYFDSERYRLHAWSVMPNHAHVLVTPNVGYSLSSIVHSWKSYTAKQANKLLKRTGVFWAPEYFDRAIRDEAHFASALSYIEMNPVNAGLCASIEDWRFSNAWKGR